MTGGYRGTEGHRWWGLGVDGCGWVLWDQGKRGNTQTTYPWPKTSSNELGYCIHGRGKLADYMYDRRGHGGARMTDNGCGWVIWGREARGNITTTRRRGGNTWSRMSMSARQGSHAKTGCYRWERRVEVRNSVLARVKRGPRTVRYRSLGTRHKNSARNCCKKQDRGDTMRSGKKMSEKHQQIVNENNSQRPGKDKINSVQASICI